LKERGRKEIKRPGSLAARGNRQGKKRGASAKSGPRSAYREKRREGGKGVSAAVQNPRPGVQVRRKGRERREGDWFGRENTLLLPRADGGKRHRLVINGGGQTEKKEKRKVGRDTAQRRKPPNRWREKKREKNDFALRYRMVQAGEKREGGKGCGSTYHRSSKTPAKKKKGGKGLSVCFLEGGGVLVLGKEKKKASEKPSRYFQSPSF